MKILKNIWNAFEFLLLVPFMFVAILFGVGRVKCEEWDDNV